MTKEEAIAKVAELLDFMRSEQVPVTVCLAVGDEMLIMSNLTAGASIRLLSDSMEMASNNEPTVDQRLQ